MTGVVAASAAGKGRGGSVNESNTDDYLITV